jgi:hypothetical protein
MGCLALNASFEPLTLVPLRRAVRLVLDRKAEILEVDEARRFRSERERAPLSHRDPARALRARPRRFRRQVTNTFLFARDDYVCQYCGRHRGNSGGGSSSPGTTLSPCRAGARTPGRTSSPPAPPATTGRATARPAKLVWCRRSPVAVERRCIRSSVVAPPRRSAATPRRCAYLVRRFVSLGAHRTSATPH